MASTPVAAPPPNPSSSTTDPSSSPPPEESKPSPPPKESESETSPPPQESKSPPPTPPPPSTPPPSPIPTPKSPPNTSTSPPKSLPPPSPPTSNTPPLSPPPPPPVTTTPPSPASQIPSPPSPILTPSSPGVLFSSPQLPTTPSDSNFPPPNAPVRKPSPHTPSSSTVDDTSGKLPLIIGITAGVGILFIFMIVIFMLCFRKKKRLPMNNQVQYYGNPPGSKGPGYYDTNSSKHQSWYPNNNQQMMEHGSNRMAAPPPGVFVAPPGSGWANQHHLNSSSEYGSHLSDPPHVMGLPASPSSGFSVNKSSFTYDELAAATNGFSQANLLGQGGFGYVHKGVLPDGKVVAVKSLKSGSGQGEREFQAEVEIISRVHHRHLVSLVGYCIAGGQRMLVYEFVPNKTMEYHLHGKGHPPMDWPKRLKIALGAAKGLAYLHEDCHPRIIHRDIKAANILIDNNFEAMVADFGLAKLTSDTYTHVSTRIMGTFGYLAPEYASSGKLTDKSDVFSFGVMLLELITGRRPVDISNSYMEDSLVDWARPLLTRNDRDYRDLVDPTLEGNYDINEMSCMVACAAASIRHSSRKRPKMSQIVRTLEGDLSLEMLNEGVKPGQSTTFTSSEQDQESYNANLKKFKKMAMEGTSEEIGSEYSGITSTYGLNPSSTSDSSSGEVVNQVPPRRLHP